MFLALREMRRAPWRFALLTGAVGLLVFLVLFVQALTGALIGQFTGALEHQSADVLVYSAQARKNLEGSLVATSTVDAVAAVSGVAASGSVRRRHVQCPRRQRTARRGADRLRAGGARRADDPHRRAASDRAVRGRRELTQPERKIRHQ
jgi:hypothetical protein